MRKIKRELQREFPQARIETTRGGHYRIVLPGGARIYTPATPSDRRMWANMRSMVKRELGVK